MNRAANRLPISRGTSNTIQAAILLATLLASWPLTPGPLGSEEVLAAGQQFSYYRIYYRFNSPIMLRYSIHREGIARLLEARDRNERMLIMARSLRLTGKEASVAANSSFCNANFDKPMGSVRCETVVDGVPLVRMIYWESGAGLLHLLLATVQKEDVSLLDSLQSSIEPNPAFYYPDDGL